MLPINYKSWHHIPDSNKNQALDNIKRFSLEVSDDYIKKALGTNGKMRLDSGIQKKGEDRERVGTSSRQKQKFTHTAGSRSFASVAQAEEVSSGQKVGRLQLFDITHRKKDGSPMTSEAGEIMEKLNEKKAEYEAVASTDSSVNLEDIDDRIITKVLGPERVDAEAREAVAAAREAEQSRKYDELQLQLQHMMQMFQQLQKQPS
ncbi:Guanine nucleotide-binding protein subunit beta-like protein [Gossypium arboreum]|uniref:Guanine nucleotide-binding protein subunit beta-like protein n=1 Tax=Gossypium arboreum TaxID=29729 RepID=A0A0B0NDW3_GOSAR|nr:Guanine nucleotide-binding protein subunit beta-like protein [Gossypium arboreum]